MRASVKFLLGVVALVGASCGYAQEEAISPDLSTIGDGKSWLLINVRGEFDREGDRTFVRLKAMGEPSPNASNAGLALVRGLDFQQGTIEIDLKGRNVRQGSFLGVTFHAVDGKTFETVYFRPFNFTADPPFRTRAVQYISWPDHPWQKLREERPGVFENAVQPVPDPDGWFHARVEVTRRQVRAFVNDATEPSLVVDRLTDRPSGGIGLWVDVHDGAFANLKIVPRPQ